MKGPYCSTCDHYDDGHPITALCSDPAKGVFTREGVRVNKKPKVCISFQCGSHTPKVVK